MTLWLLITAALGCVAWLAIWSRRPSKARWLTVLAFLAASPVSGASLLMSLGWPVPLIPYIAAPSGDMEVLGAKIIPEVGIYVMLDVGEDDPRLFALPWDPKMASKLQRMMEGVEGEGTMKVKMQGSMAPGEFYMEKAPAQMLPDKPREQQGFRYERTQ